MMTKILEDGGGFLERRPKEEKLIRIGSVKLEARASGRKVDCSQQLLFCLENQTESLLGFREKEAKQAL